MISEPEQPSPWYFGFEEYERISEPNKREKSFAWTTAIGLQAVDGLTPSKYLLETARRHIEGEISIQEANQIIEDYYQTEIGRKENESGRTEEADKVSARIAEILNDGTFDFRPTALQNIHERLFRGIYKFAGKIRNYNISKKERVLDGDTVYYTDFSEIQTALKYDFENEKNFSYANISRDDFVKHFAKFISSIWQVHAFGEGNTRTTAVFTIKYLRFLGYDVNNLPFVENSWYFRNALVRANYNSTSKNISGNGTFLELFFRNLLLGEQHELKNRYTHIYWNGNFGEKQILNSDLKPENPSLKSENYTENYTENLKTTQKIIEFVKSNPSITTIEMAEKLSLTRDGINWQIKKLKKQGILCRVGPDKGGHWEIIEK